MKTAVVVLVPLTEEEIRFYTKRRRSSRISHMRCSRPERKKKTEASRNLRDVERVDFSLYEDYRKSRKNYIKKTEKRKRKQKSPEKSPKKKRKRKIPPQDQEQPVRDGEIPLSGLNSKSSKKAKKSKHKKDPDGTPKSKKKKLRRVFIEESDSDCNIDNYGLFYAEEKNSQEFINGGFQNSQDLMNGFQNPPDLSTRFQNPPDLSTRFQSTHNFFNVLPPPPSELPSTQLDFASIPQQMPFTNLIPGTIDDDSDDILSALCIQPNDDFSGLGIVNDSLPIQNPFPSETCDTDKVNAITSRLFQSVDYSSEHIGRQLDVVGDILSLMDSSFSNKAKVPNTVVHEPAVSMPYQQPQLKQADNVLVTETVPPKPAKLPTTTTNCLLDDPLPIVKQVLDGLLKKVSTRNKRNISLQSKEVEKGTDKKCSLCNNSFVQVKSETICCSCKTYTVNQLTSGLKNSCLIKTDKLVQPVKEQVESLQKVSTSSCVLQKATAKPVSSLKPTPKQGVLQKVNYTSSYRSNLTRSFRSTILLTSPLKQSSRKHRATPNLKKKSPTKLGVKKSPVKHNLKKSPIKLGLKKSPTKHNLKGSPHPQLKLNTKKIKSLNSKGDTPKKLKGSSAENVKRVLKNFSANERHRIMYKNNAKAKPHELPLSDEKYTKAEENETNSALNSVDKSLNLQSTIMKQAVVPAENALVEGYEDDYPECSNEDTIQQNKSENILFTTSNINENVDNSIQKLQNTTAKSFSLQNREMLPKALSEEVQAVFNHVEDSSKIELTKNVSLISLKSTDDISLSCVDSGKESSMIYNLSEAAAGFTGIQLKETSNDTCSLSVVGADENPEDLISDSNLTFSSKPSLLPLADAIEYAGELFLNPVSEVIAMSTLPVVTVTNSSPTITPIPAVSDINASQISSPETMSACHQTLPALEEEEEDTVSAHSGNAASTSSLNQTSKELSRPSTSMTANIQQNSQTVPSQKPPVKADDSKTSISQTAIHEVEAFSILSVLDIELDLDSEHTRRHIEQLLWKEIAILNKLKNVNFDELEENMVKLANRKIAHSSYRIKSLMVACILWIQCGSLKKVEEYILTKQVSKAVATANREFESRKLENDLQDWYSRNLVVQAKMEKQEKSDCMFSGNNASAENNLIPNLTNFETNITQSLNSSRISEPPFVLDTFTDETIELDEVLKTKETEPLVIPKLETSTSCMYSNNNVIDSAPTLVSDVNYASVPTTSSVQSPASVSDLRHLSIPSPLQSPAGSLIHANFNPSPVMNINSQNMLVPVTLQPRASQVINEFDSNINNVPRMSPALLQSQSPRSSNLLNHSLHNINTPHMSPRSLQSPSSQPFNSLDFDSVLSQTIGGSSRRSSTSSVEPPASQRPSIIMKQEKDATSKSPCPNSNNAIVPYGFLPTPSPTPPQPIMTQTQFQQPPQNQQLSTSLNAQQNSTLSSQLRPHTQQMSQHYASLLRSASYETSVRPPSSNQSTVNQVWLQPSAAQAPANLIRRIASNRLVLPFGNNTSTVNMGMLRNAPPNVTIQGTPHPNFLANRTMAASVALQLQNANLSVNQSTPQNVSLRIQGPNPSSGINRALPSRRNDVSNMALKNINNSGTTNFGQQQVPVSNTMVPVNLHQFLLSSSMPTSVNVQNQNNFIVPYSNNPNNYIPPQQQQQQQSPIVSQPSGTRKNLLLSMLTTSPVTNCNTNAQPITNPHQPPPPYNSVVTNQNVTLPPQPSNNTQRDKLMYCAVCNKPATMRCKQCTKVVYCNAACARIYWHQRHKMECKTA